MMPSTVPLEALEGANDIHGNVDVRVETAAAGTTLVQPSKDQLDWDPVTENLKEPSSVLSGEADRTNIDRRRSLLAV
jgi:hypothetical protein